MIHPVLAPNVFTTRLLHKPDAMAFRLFTFASMEHLLDEIGPNAFAIGLFAPDASNGDANIPAGLAIVTLVASKHGTLSSLFVAPAWRQRQGGALLMQAILEECAVRGIAELDGSYIDGLASTPALQALLQSSRWSPPRPNMLVIHATLQSIAEAPWLRTYKLPPGMAIEPWVGLSSEVREALRQSDAQEGWIAKDLYPFNHEAQCEPVTSLALLHHGQVIGWVINHAVGKTLRYTCSYMHPRHQRLGRIVFLYNEAVARMPLAGFEQGMWTVPFRHPAMVAFARRWMAPFSTRFCQSHWVQRSLEPAVLASAR